VAPKGMRVQVPPSAPNSCEFATHILVNNFQSGWRADIWPARFLTRLKKLDETGIFEMEGYLAYDK
jgi:hypothetical protein